jgi:hypothetical protein
MPRKPKASLETLSAAAPESAAPAPEKKAIRKNANQSANPAKAPAARARNTATPAQAPATTRKRAANPNTPVRRVSTAKSNGTSRAILGADSYHDDIARLADHFWEQRGHAEGSPDEDWLRAEQEYRRTVLLESA